MWDLHRRDEAIEWYRRAIELRPDLPQPMLNFGVALSDLGEFEEAAQWIHESIRLQPDLPGSHVSLGNLLLRQGDLDGANDCFEQALELRPDFAEARRARAYLWLARGEYARAWPEHEWRLKCPELLVVPVNSTAVGRRRPCRPIDPACRRARPRRHVAVHSLCSGGQKTKWPGGGRVS